VGIQQKTLNALGFKLALGIQSFLT